MFPDYSYVNRQLFPVPPASYTHASLPRHLIEVPAGGGGGKRTIPCLFVHQRNHRRFVLYAHGNAEDLGLIYEDMVTLSKETSSNVIAVEMPGYGIAGGTPSEESVSRQFMDVYGFVLSVFNIEPESVVLMGRSIGTGIVARAAAERPPAAVVLVSAYTSIQDVVRDVCGRVAACLVAPRFDTLSVVERLDVPTLLIHGTEDAEIDYNHSVALAKCAPRAQLRLIPRMGHNDIDFQACVTPHVASFVARHAVDSTNQWLGACSAVVDMRPTFPARVPRHGAPAWPLVVVATTAEVSASVVRSAFRSVSCTSGTKRKAT